MSTVTTDNAVEVWKLIKSGDKSAFEKLYVSFYHDLYRYGYKIAGDKELVKDTLHHFFLEIWDNRHQLNEVSSLKPYLLKYFRRKLFKVMESGKKEVDLQNVPVKTESSYEQLLINNQSSELLKKKLSRGLEKLSRKQKDVIRMKFFEGLTYEEIAEVTNSTIRTVYNQVYEALKMLKHDIKV